MIATSKSDGHILRYQSNTPPVDAEGDVGAMPLYAGQSAALVKKRQPAGEIVREVNDQAEEIFRRLAR